MKDICYKAKLPQRTASDIVKDMHKNGLVIETTGFSRNKVYMLKDYVDAFKVNELGL